MSKELKVSQNTANFIGCLQTMQNLYGQVIDALTELYGEKNALELINNGFMSRYNDLEKAVQEFLLLSISSNMGLLGYKEI